MRTYKDIRKKVSGERVEVKRAEQAKVSAAVAHKWGYINTSEYHKKIRSIDTEKNS